MRDWKQYVREQLPPLELTSAREQEIVDELAQQLEDSYTEAISHGLAPEQANLHTAAQISDWSALAHEIRKADQLSIAEIVNAAVSEEWRRSI